MRFHQQSAESALFLLLPSVFLIGFWIHEPTSSVVTQALLNHHIYIYLSRISAVLQFSRKQYRIIARCSMSEQHSKETDMVTTRKSHFYWTNQANFLSTYLKRVDLAEEHSPIFFVRWFPSYEETKLIDIPWYKVSRILLLQLHLSML